MSNGDFLFPSRIGRNQPACGKGLSCHSFFVSCSFAVAAEQKARSTYDNILRFADDPDVRDPIKFLREREIVHYQRFGEAKRTKGQQVTTRGKHGAFCGPLIVHEIYYPPAITNLQKSHKHLVLCSNSVVLHNKSGKYRSMLMKRMTAYFNYE